MLSTTRTIATLILGTLLVAACGAAGTTSSPTSLTTAPPASEPTATPLPTTDGQGPEHFTGVMTSSPALTTSYTTTQVGEVTQYRGGVAEWNFTTNDVRISGTATWDFSVDGYGPIGPQWGRLTIDGGFGKVWSGTCTGGAWEESDKIAVGCWLTGSTVLKGYSAYFSVTKFSAEPGRIEGVIFPGAVPKF